MGRLLIGSLVAAVAMFLLGFVFHATPLSDLGYADAPVETQLAVQETLKALPATGTYYIPFSETDAAIKAAHEAGPRALIRVNLTGAPQMNPAVFALGFLHMAVSAFLLGLLLWAFRERIVTIGDRMTLVLWVALVMAFFTRIGEPIWYGVDWANSLYVAVTEFISLTVAGFILAKWFVPGARVTTP